MSEKPANTSNDKSNGGEDSDTAFEDLAKKHETSAIKLSGNGDKKTGDGTPGIYDRWGYVGSIYDRWGNLVWLVVIALVVLAVGVGGWYIYGRNYKTIQPTIPTTTTTTPKEKETSKAAVKPPTTTPEKAPTSQAVTKPPAPTDINSNIEAAMNSGNFAALEGYMAPSVMVLIWSSEGPGPQTPTQAVTALAYLNTATAPWDFNLPAAFKTDRIDVWPTYFTNPTTALVGKSANDKLIMINFDNSGKINVIIMAFGSNM